MRLDDATLHGLLMELDPIERWEARTGSSNPLASWVDAGPRAPLSDDAEVRGLSRLVRDGRLSITDLLLAQPDETPRTADAPDVDWSRALAAQRRIRALASRESTAVPAAVLQLLATTAPPGTPLAAVCDRVGQHFAAPALRAAWSAPAKRPGRDRTVPPAAIGRGVLGRALVEGALCAWRGEPWTPPAWLAASLPGAGRARVAE